MTKFLKCSCALLVVTAVIFCVSVVSDRLQLNSKIIRLHIVAESDSEQDQAVKLQVRDAILTHLEAHMTQEISTDEACAYLQEHLDELEDVAQAVLDEYGLDYCAQVTLQKESFDIRHYDTFSLPSGVYQSLRICLGDAQGRNWWCVVFPSFCFASSTALEDVSAFSDQLNDTIQNKEGYQLRFFLLDFLGNLEKLFFSE